MIIARAGRPVARLVPYEAAPRRPGGLAQTAGALPPHHRDPFDRMLIAQATVEHATLVTRDPAIAAYKVAVLGA